MFPNNFCFLDYMKELAKARPKSICFFNFRKGNNKFKEPSMNFQFYLEMKKNTTVLYCNFSIIFGNVLSPRLTAEWLEVYFSTDYHNAWRNVIILFWKYWVGIWEWGLARSFLEYKIQKLFAVCCLSDIHIMESNGRHVPVVAKVHYCIINIHICSVFCSLT